MLAEVCKGLVIACAAYRIVARGATALQALADAWVAKAWFSVDGRDGLRGSQRINPLRPVGISRSGLPL